jgi:diguanylate cyclase (GGDEF)-like protein
LQLTHCDLRRNLQSAIFLLWAVNTLNARCRVVGKFNRFVDKFNLPVSGRILSIIALLLLAQLVVAAIGYNALTAQRAAQDELRIAGLARFHEQDADMLHDGVRASVLASVLHEAAGGAALVEYLQNDTNELRANIQALDRLEMGADVSASLVQVRPLVDQYINLALEVGQLAAVDGARARARLPAFEEAFEQLRVALERQTTLISKVIDAAGISAQVAADAARSQILFASLGVVLLASCLAWLLSKSIQSSLRAVSNTAKQMADGNLDVRSTISSHDELGDTARALNRMAGSLRELIARLRADAERDAFGTQLVEALEMSDTEPETHRVIARAMGAVAPDRPMELLLADSSRANLERAAQHPTEGAPGCGVESPFSCVAVRRGNPVSFENSDALNACPRLRGRPQGAISAVCVPVSFMGRSLGVLHAAGPANQLPSSEQIKHLTTLGIQAGSRIGTVRAFERTQHQASTDALTGLANRRTLADVANTLLSSQSNFAFVMIDLDHFKRLNDTFGHEAGDNALRTFSEALRQVFRAEDHPARWGGEEFAVIVTGVTAEQAGNVVDRLRARLAELLLATGGNPFTASFGIADTSMARQLDQLVRIADDALYQAKETGRDKHVTGDPTRVRTVVPRRDSEQKAAINLASLAEAG